MHVKPVMVDCNFIVDSANGNGLGIRSLKGTLVSNVYMHTSASKAPGSPGGTTGPAAGTIVLQLQDNYNRILGSSFSILSPLGSNLKVDASDAALTPGVAYTVTIVGDALPADWLALGVPSGLINQVSVGMSFIAAVSGSGVASVTRVAPTAAAGSGSFIIEGVGDANQSIAPNPTANQGFGSQIIMQVRNASGSSAASAIAAPADGSIIALQLLLSDSSVSSGGPGGLGSV